MWSFNAKAEFAECISELIDHPLVQSMDAVKHHVHKVTCLDHCLFVSYVGFVMAKKLNLDYRAVARAGLLHDLYLCDWSKTNVSRFRRLLIHPGMALENASCFELSALERDIISKHMWPVTLWQVPSYRESVVVNIADKLCATVEFMHLYQLLKTKDTLLSFNHRKCASVTSN